MANEKRLIYAEDAKEALLGWETDPTDDEIEYTIDNLPTAKAVEVVHGRWVWDVETHGDPMYGVDEDFGYRCSRCKVWADEYGVDGDIYEEPPTHILHYCPNCGADMMGDGNG